MEQNEKYKIRDKKAERTTHPDGSVTEWVSKEEVVWLMGWGNMIGRNKGIRLQVNQTGRERTVRGTWWQRLWNHEPIEVEVRYTELK